MKPPDRRQARKRISKVETGRSVSPVEKPRRLQVYLAPSLFRRAKIEAARRDISLSAFVAELLEEVVPHE